MAVNLAGFTAILILEMGIAFRHFQEREATLSAGIFVAFCRDAANVILKISIYYFRGTG